MHMSLKSKNKQILMFGLYSCKKFNKSKDTNDEYEIYKKKIPNPNNFKSIDT